MNLHIGTYEMDMLQTEYDISMNGMIDFVAIDRDFTEYIKNSSQVKALTKQTTMIGQNSRWSNSFDVGNNPVMP